MFVNEYVGISHQIVNGRSGSCEYVWTKWSFWAREDILNRRYFKFWTMFSWFYGVDCYANLLQSRTPNIILARMATTGCSGGRWHSNSSVLFPLKGILSCWGSDRCFKGFWKLSHIHYHEHVGYQTLFSGKKKMGEKNVMYVPHPLMKSVMAKYN